MTIDEGFYSPTKNSSGQKQKTQKARKSPTKAMKTPNKMNASAEIGPGGIQLQGKFDLDVEPNDTKANYTLEGIAGMV